MGNASTKESRSDQGRRYLTGSGLDSDPSAPASSDRTSSRRNRASRNDLGGILGLSSTGSSSRQDAPAERRETKQEREARRLERERVARVKERERSLKEEHVDGGYLVTLGTYTGPEDFNKQIVRQLQIERKLAPFWRGLNDFDDKWTEHQIIAVARGLPLPPADQAPPEELIPRPPPPEPPAAPAQNINLTVPIGDRSSSVASDHSASNNGSPWPPTSSAPPRASSPFKPRGKALASVLGGISRNGSTTEIVPREINLPHDPFVNGQPLEVFLYKDATECPICFLTYPPYLNHTRCCDQPICSECFVQIKRPAPHYPEGHNEDDPNRDPEETAGLLVSEPACCPYCTQPDFGVIYEPPPFRRGLTHASSPAFGTMHTAMSSSISLGSPPLSPPPPSPGSAGNRRRGQSVSAQAPNVILTDRVRPDWSTKLQAARAHQARRAAAATALHTAAFLMGNNEPRPFRVGRFGRRNTAAPGPASAGGDAVSPGGSGAETPTQPGPEPGPRSSSNRGLLPGVGGGGGAGGGRSRMEDLEDMMFMEAVRLSLAAEEDRKRKTEKAERKEAKRREKEEKKAAKAAAKHGHGPYGDGRSGYSSANASSLSLHALGFGRKRGNSAASNIRAETSATTQPSSTSGSGSPTTCVAGSKDKGKGVDRDMRTIGEDGGGDGEPGCADPTSPSSCPTASSSRPVPPQHQPADPSHLRQMSNASSASCSLHDSHPGSYTQPPHLQDPRASGISLGSRSGASEDGNEQDRDRDPSASTEPMFNFHSLAAVVGVSLEGENAGRRLSRIAADDMASGGVVASFDADVIRDDDSKDGAVEERVENAHGYGSPDEVGCESGQPRSAATDDGGSDVGSQPFPQEPSHLTPPRLMITPDTPVPTREGEEASKQLGYQTTVERLPQGVTR